MDAKESLQQKPLTGVNLTPQHSRKLKTVSLPGQVVVGGYDAVALSSTETFPPLTSATCAVPKLSQTQARTSPTLSLLSNGRLVVCGGVDRDGNRLRSCIYWAAGNNSWTHFFDTRCLPSSECKSGQNYFCYQLSIQVPFRYHILPVPVLFSLPNFTGTGSGTT